MTDPKDSIEGGYTHSDSNPELVERAAAMLREHYGPQALEHAKELEKRSKGSKFAALVRQRLQKDEES